MKGERAFAVLLEPHISEKVSVLGDHSNQYAFKVARDATKKEIETAVEQLFGVSVQKVTTLNMHGGIKRSWRGVARKKAWKKAYVRIAPGQELDYMAAE